MFHSESLCNDKSRVRFAKAASQPEPQTVSCSTFNNPLKLTSLYSHFQLLFPVFFLYFSFQSFSPSHGLRQSWFRRLSRNFRTFFVVQLFGDSRSQLCTVLCLIFLSLQMEGGPLHPWITQFSAYLAKFLSLAWGNDEDLLMVMNYDFLAVSVISTK